MQLLHLRLCPRQARASQKILSESYTMSSARTGRAAMLRDSGRAREAARHPGPCIHLCMCVVSTPKRHRRALAWARTPYKRSKCLTRFIDRSWWNTVMVEVEISRKHHTPKPVQLSYRTKHENGRVEAQTTNDSILHSADTTLYPWRHLQLGEPMSAHQPKSAATPASDLTSTCVRAVEDPIYGPFSSRRVEADARLRSRVDNLRRDDFV